VEKPATIQTKQETAHSLRVGDVGAPATLEVSLPQIRNGEMGVHLRILWTISLKEGAVWHVC
jgi:hypothetical protein